MLDGPDRPGLGKGGPASYGFGEGWGGCALALVLSHRQYCLMVWGDFRDETNQTLVGSLLRYQKQIARLLAGKRGLYHSETFFARFGMLKIGNLYRQQGARVSLLEGAATSQSGCNGGQDRQCPAVWHQVGKDWDDPDGQGSLCSGVQGSQGVAYSQGGADECGLACGL